MWHCYIQNKLSFVLEVTSANAHFKTYVLRMKNIQNDEKFFNMLVFKMSHINNKYLFYEISFGIQIQSVLH